VSFFFSLPSSLSPLYVTMSLPAAFGPDTLVDLFLGGLPETLTTRMGADRNGQAWHTWEDAEQAAIAADTFIKTAAQLQSFKQRAHAAPLQALQDMQARGQTAEPVDMEESNGGNNSPAAGQQEGAQLGAMGGNGRQLVYGRNNTLDPSLDCYHCTNWGHRKEVCPFLPPGQPPAKGSGQSAGQGAGQSSRGGGRGGSRGGYNNCNPAAYKRGRDDDYQGGSGGYGGGYSGNKYGHNQGRGGNRQYNQGGQRQYNNYHSNRGSNRGGNRYRQARIGAIGVPYPEQE
jgi:hypothetical protein